MTLKQILISTQVCHSPNGAQGEEYKRRCEDAYRSNPLQCPLARSGSKVHFHIQQCLATVLFRQDREVMKHHKVRSIGLSQDLARLLSGFSLSLTIFLLSSLVCLALCSSDCDSLYLLSLSLSLSPLSGPAPSPRAAGRPWSP